MYRELNWGVLGRRDLLAYVGCVGVEWNLLAYVGCFGVEWSVLLECMAILKNIFSSNAICYSF